MRREHLDLLRCPRTGATFQWDPTRVAGDEAVEGFLISADERRVYPVAAGVAALPLDLRENLRQQGAVWWRTPVNDPRMARFVRGAAGRGYIKVEFEDVVGHYRDLADDPPPGYRTTSHPEDVALARLLAAMAVDAPTRSLAVGCGVGRAVFTVNAFGGSTLGTDTSLAHVRRARNIAVTVEDFFLPGDKGLGVKTILLDLGRLVREGTDFLVADPQALPFAADTFDLVLLHGDHDEREARRVLRSDGWLVGRMDAGAGDAGREAPVHAEAPWGAWRS